MWDQGNKIYPFVFSPVLYMQATYSAMTVLKDSPEFNVNTVKNN